MSLSRQKVKPRSDEVFEFCVVTPFWRIADALSAVAAAARATPRRHSRCMYRTHGYPVDLEARNRVRRRRRTARRRSTIWSFATRWFNS
jgi:hypothetical protein